jgi:serine/threonine-protein kinase
MYLEARTAIERNTRADNERGIGLLRQALAMQPDFALAWVGLAWAYAQTAASAWVPFAEGYGRAREAAQQALTLAPDLADGHQALAAVLLAHDFDWKRAAAEIQRALELAPDNVQSLRSAGNLAAIEGRIDDAVAFAREMVTRDPLSLAARRNLVWICLDAGELDEAEAAINKAFELGPGSGHIHAARGCLRLQQGRFDEALAEFSAELLPIFRGRGIATAHYAMGHRSESDAALAELVALRAQTGAFQIAEVHAYRGEASEAFAWLERALAQRDPGVTGVKSTFFLRKLYRDSRWQPFLAKMGLSD